MIRRGQYKMPYLQICWFVVPEFYSDHDDMNLKL